MNTHTYVSVCVCVCMCGRGPCYLLLRPLIKSLAIDRLDWNDVARSSGGRTNYVGGLMTLSLSMSSSDI